MKLAKQAVDLSGQKFNRLTAIKPIKRSAKGRIIYLWKCDCGNEKEIAGYLVKRGSPTSCGCLFTEQLSARSTTHGMRYTTEYASWLSMRNRCNRTNDVAYDYYGGRGVKVCKEWDNSFEAFFKDMGNKPSKGYDIDRIDNDGDYTPENCRWLSRSANVKRNSGKKRNKK